MSKLTDKQKCEIALDMLCSKLTHAEVYRKHGISASYAYKIKDRAVEILRAGIGRSVRQSDQRAARLQQRLQALEQLIGDQALAIRILTKKLRARTGRAGMRKVVPTR